MAGASVLCIPAFAHPDSVTALFVAMAGPEADWVRRFIVAFTPVALLVTSVGMLMAVRAGHSGWALAQFAALLALAVLPPQVGFLLYFVFLHSPLHMRGVAATLPSWSGPRFWIYGGLMCFACLALAVSDNHQSRKTESTPPFNNRSTALDLQDAVDLGITLVGFI
jgi:hypothetical protein